MRVEPDALRLELVVNDGGSMGLPPLRKEAMLIGPGFPGER